MFLEGTSIYLREVRESDIGLTSNYYKWITDLKVTKYLETRFYPQSVEKIAEYVREQNSNHNTVFLAIILKENTQHHIGNIKLVINWIHQYAEISLVISKDYWNKGIGTEAIKLASAYALNVLGLHKLIAGAYSENIGSIKAFQKAGFKIEGEIKEMYYSEGKRTGRILLGRTK